MKTIIVPTDFSKAADNALKVAKFIAEKTKATIHLASFYSIPMANYSFPDISMPAEVLEQIRQAAKENMKELTDELETEGFTVASTIAIGMAADEIVDLANKINADLIVMGTTGGSGMLSNIIGSNAAQVMKRTMHPIILVPQDCMFDGVDNLVYLDELKEDDTPVLSKLFDFADELGADNIRLLNINTGFFYQLLDEELLTQLKTTFGSERIKLETVDGADVKEGIDHYLENHMVDLVVMSTHKKTLLERIFSKNNTNKMALYSKVPLMVYHKE